MDSNLPQWYQDELNKYDLHEAKEALEDFLDNYTTTDAETILYIDASDWEMNEPVISWNLLI